MLFVCWSNLRILKTSFCSKCEIRLGSEAVSLSIFGAPLFKLCRAVGPLEVSWISDV